MGDPTDFRNLMGAVIHASAFEKITGYIDRADASPDVDILVGGDYDDSEGYFIRPTIMESRSPEYESMCEEIFGPVVTVYVYPRLGMGGDALADRYDVSLCSDRSCVCE